MIYENAVQEWFWQRERFCSLRKDFQQKTQNSYPGTASAVPLAVVIFAGLAAEKLEDEQ